MHGLTTDDELDYWRERAKAAEKQLADAQHALANGRQVTQDLSELGEAFVAFLDYPQTIEAIGDAKASVTLSPASAMTGAEQTRAIGVLRDLIGHLQIRASDVRRLRGRSRGFRCWGSKEKSK